MEDKDYLRKLVKGKLSNLSKDELLKIKKSIKRVKAKKKKSKS